MVRVRTRSEDERFGTIQSSALPLIRNVGRNSGVVDHGGVGQKRLQLVERSQAKGSEVLEDQRADGIAPDMSSVEKREQHSVVAADVDGCLDGASVHLAERRGVHVLGRAAETVAKAGQCGGRKQQVRLRVEVRGHPQHAAAEAKQDAAFGADGVHCWLQHGAGQRGGQVHTRKSRGAQHRRVERREQVLQRAERGEQGGVAHAHGHHVELESGRGRRARRDSEARVRVLVAAGRAALHLDLVDGLVVDGDGDVVSVRQIHCHLGLRPVGPARRVRRVAVGTGSGAVGSRRLLLLAWRRAEQRERLASRTRSEGERRHASDVPRTQHDVNLNAASGHGLANSDGPSCRSRGNTVRQWQWNIYTLPTTFSRGHLRVCVNCARSPLDANRCS